MNKKLNNKWMKKIYLKNSIKNSVNIEKSIMASHWAFVVRVLYWFVVLVNTDWMSTVSSAFKLFLMWLQWLSAYTAFRIVSGH